VSAPDDDIPLLPGPGFEKDLEGGQTHSYKISVAANQYLQVVIEQRGINLITTLLDSQGKELLRADNPNGAHGPIYLFAISQTAADYRVEVRSTEPAYRRSLYFDKSLEVQIDERLDWRLRASIFNDRGANLGRLGNEPEALKSLDEAFKIYEQHQDRRGEASVFNNFRHVLNCIR
jgi:hypothetical protein